MDYSDVFEISDVLKRSKRIQLRFVQIVMWVTLTAMGIHASIHSEELVFRTAELVSFTPFLVPFMLLGALYGYVISLISFAITFIFTLVYDMESAYMSAIFLVAAMCFALFSQFFWFQTKKKTFVAALITMVATAVIEFMCLSVIRTANYGVSVRGQFFDYLRRENTTILFLAFLIHFYVTKAPDIWKVPYYMVRRYTKAFQNNEQLKRRLRVTKVGAKINVIIIGIELIMGVYFSVFMIALFPDLKNMFVRDIKENVTYDGRISDEEATNILVSRLDAIEYRFDDAAVTFDIKMILLMMCVGIPMAGFTNYYIKYTLGWPLAKMSDAMNDFARADDEKRPDEVKKIDRLNIKNNDEIRVVYDAMKTTAHAIEEYLERLEKDQKLQTELEVAKRASEAKSSFLSNMSHEIRTPINAVLGMNEMILRESRDENILEYANNIKGAGNSLLSIINDILDYSKIEAGKMTILPVQYHLGSIINDLMNMISMKAHEKGLKLDINVDRALPTNLIGDEVRIKQCVTNILSNAVKYTEKGTVTMSVTFKRIDDRNIKLRFSVADTGIGIKEEDLQKLYSPFERIEEIRNRTVEGTGLGMSIVKRLLAMMDSKLEVQSEYGKGSEFAFEIKQQVVSWEEIGDFKEKYKEYIRSLGKYHESFKAPDAEILVVDDTVMNLTVVKGLLKKTEIQIDTAESGMETLEKVKEKRYDAIFIDHRMPEMDGIQTLEIMKTMEDNLNTDVPCIALTANAGENAKEEYLKVGFDDYLSKPVNGMDLEEMLLQYLPKEKVVLMMVDSSGEIISPDPIEGSKEKEPESEDFLPKLKEISLKDAITNCGSEDILREVVKEFLVSIDNKADNIEKFAAEKDYRNYTVAVHALKSSARLIGALDLSERAAYLEQCGNDENEDEISSKTGELLELYRSYKDNLAAAEDKKAENLPAIPIDELNRAFKDIKELVEAYDYDTADRIMKMLEDYSIPAEAQEKFGKVKELMALVNRDELLEIL